MGKNTNELLLRVEGLRKKIYENKEKKEYDNQYSELFPSTKGVRAEKAKLWSESDWS